MALPPKQKLFVQEYLKDKNGARAARAAGYSKRSAREQAVRLLSNASIKELVEAGMAKQLEKAEASAERTVKEIADLAYQKLNKLEMKRFSGNKIKALELLGKHFKVFTEVVESKSVVKEIPPTEEEIKEWGKRFKNEF